MIRIFAASLSVAALVGVSLPAAAQQTSKGQTFRAPAQPGAAVKRLSAPRQPAAPRRLRSFNPPAPQIATGQRLHRSFTPPGPGGNVPTTYSRGLAPPSPGVVTAPIMIGPQAPAGGYGLVPGAPPVPSSLPVSLPAEASPTAAPTAQLAEETAQPTDSSPQGDLQAPIPETVSAQPMPAVGEEMRVSRLVAVPTTQQIAPAPLVRHVYEVRVVYVPIHTVRRVHRRHHVHFPHHVIRGHRVHFGPHFHRGFRRW